MKSILRQHWAIVFLSTVALSFIAAQAFLSTHRDRGVKEIYFADRLTDAHRILIDDYNRLNAGKVRVIPIDFPNEDFTTNERKEVLARSLRGEGEGIDLFAVDPIWVQRFERWSEPLDPYFSDEEIKSLTDDGLRSCYKDGRLVAIPFGTVRGVLLYREDLVRALPNGKKILDDLNRGITWERFIDYGKGTGGRNPFYVFPAADYEGLLCSFAEVLLSCEKEYFETHGFDFVTPSARKALGLLVDLVQTHKLTPAGVTAMTEVSSYEYFMEHNAMFLRGWTSYDKDFADTSDRARSIRKAPLPHFSNGARATTIGGWNLMVSKFSSKKEEAIDFAKFLLRKESQEIVFTRGGLFPVVSALYEEEPYIGTHPELLEMHRMLNHGVHRPSHEKYTKYSDILARYVSLAIAGRIGIDEALVQATMAIESEKILFESKDHPFTGALP